VEWIDMAATEERMAVEARLEELAARVSGGDTAAVDELALTLKQFIQPYVRKALRGLKTAGDEAEDLSQDVWLECYRVVGQYNPARGRAAAYFGRVAFQAASYKSRSLRHRSREVPTDPNDPQSTILFAVDDLQEHDPETLVMVRESVRNILELMQQSLPPDLVDSIAAGDFREAERAGRLTKERAHAIQLARRRARRLLRHRWEDLPEHLKSSR
jgi:DNA-directed RNA polymerase specialized sigma24 family protein